MPVSAIVRGSEESFVRLDGALLQIYAVGNFVKFICRLIESDMAVVAKSQKFGGLPRQETGSALHILRIPYRCLALCHPEDVY